jgi:hypothetical protein
MASGPEPARRIARERFDASAPVAARLRADSELTAHPGTGPPQPRRTRSGARPTAPGGPCLAGVVDQDGDLYPMPTFGRC